MYVLYNNMGKVKYLCRWSKMVYLKPTEVHKVFRGWMIEILPALEG